MLGYVIVCPEGCGFESLLQVLFPNFFFFYLLYLKMSTPLNELCVKAFDKLRDWVKTHEKFNGVLEEYKKGSNFVVSWAVSGNIDHYLNSEFSCTEILGFLEQGITDGYLVEIECSTTGKKEVVLSEDLVAKLKEKEITDGEVARLKGFANYFYGIWLRSLEA
jgi:hypothetical protein